MSQLHNPYVYFETRIYVSRTPGRISRRSWIVGTSADAKRGRNETKRRWRASSKRKRRKRAEIKRTRKRKSEIEKREREREIKTEGVPTALDVASLTVTTATDCPNDVGCSPSSLGFPTPNVESRLIAAINIKPTSRHRLFTLWPAPITPSSPFTIAAATDFCAIYLRYYN